MPVNIDVLDSHAQLLIEFYMTRMKALRDEIIEKEREMKEINQVVQKLKKRNMTEHPDIKPDNAIVLSDYSDKWPWVKKIAFAIENQGKPLTTKEIVETLTEYEPSFLFDRKRVVASISSILSTKSGAGKDFVRLQNVAGDFAYDISYSPKREELEKSDDSLELDDNLPF